MESFHEKHHIRCALVVDKSDKFTTEMASEILKNISIPIEKVIFVDRKEGLNSPNAQVMMENDVYSYVYKTAMKTFIIKEKSKVRYRSNKFVIIDYYKPTRKRSEKVMIESPTQTGLDFRDASKEYKILHSYIDNSLNIYNALLYQPDSSIITLKSISSFNSTTLKWNNTNIIQKYENFYGCEINVFFITQ
jgi:hypothetical protein